MKIINIFVIQKSMQECGEFFFFFFAITTSDHLVAALEHSRAEDVHVVHTCMYLYMYTGSWIYISQDV